MDEQLIQAWNKGWDRASLLTKAIIIIETDILLDIFKGEATTENCEIAHNVAVRTAKRIINEINKQS
mgnify:FL=1